MPSSLATSTRAFLRSTELRAIGGDHFEPAHVGAERLGHGDGPIGPLAVFEDRDQGPPDRQRGPVEGMDEAGLLSPLTRNRAFMRRAWKSPQLEQLEISR